ncbi:MAG: glycosyltransferase family 4 protein [Anaerolineae bacterium]
MDQNLELCNTPQTILYVDHAAALGGAERSLLLLLHHLDRRQFRPLLASNPGPLADAAADLHVPVFTIPMPRLRSWPAPLLDLWRGARALADIIRRERVVIVHSNVMRASFFGALSSKLTRRTFVWHVRDIHTERWYTWLMSRLSDRALAVSDAAARPLHSSQVTVIHNGVDLAEFDPSLIDGASFRTELGVPNDTPLVGIVGRIRPWKGQQYFLAAASEVARLVPAARFLVVGGTIFPAKEDYLRQLRRLAGDYGIPDRVTFTGHRRDVPEVLAALDILVHCSDAEPFARVVIEAMAMAKPIVAFADGGTPEAVLDRDTGLLVPPGDVAALAAGIEHLLLNEPLRHAMGEKGRSRVEAMFTAEQMTRKVEKVYEELLSPRTARTFEEGR